ncbi:hypothetical protein [Streptomyces sp. ODS28]|uniref:hypothetical protein n=1 Tax=Streptomyces sp. ODS28 TaxID=3136688 RepID=UPI0031F179EB
MTPRVIVHLPSSTGGRRVTVDDQILGLAHSERDVIEFLRRAGLDEDDMRLDDGDVIEWRCGGRDVWM